MENFTLSWIKMKKNCNLGWIKMKKNEEKWLKET